MLVHLSPPYWLVPKSGPSMDLFNNKRGKKYIGQTLYFAMKNTVFIRNFHLLFDLGKSRGIFVTRMSYSGT
jgi:hypothetical protein